VLNFRSQDLKLLIDLLKILKMMMLNMDPCQMKVKMNKKIDILSNLLKILRNCLDWGQKEFWHFLLIKASKNQTISINSLMMKTCNKFFNLKVIGETRLKRRSQAMVKDLKEFYPNHFNQEITEVTMVMVYSKEKHQLVAISKKDLQIVNCRKCSSKY
jgi:hypothetical protein